VKQYNLAQIVAPPGPARPARIPAAVTVVTHLGCIVNVVAHLAARSRNGQKMSGNPVSVLAECIINYFSRKIKVQNVSSGSLKNL
jgi:hypothetical protein